MLGLQETRPTGNSSTKSYSCVACSATFHGLASLLVHQASHASEVSNPLGPTSPVCRQCGGLFASAELLEKHRCMLLPPPVIQDFYVCECGESFQEFDAMQEHKKIHHNEPSIKIEVVTVDSFSVPGLVSESSPSSHVTEVPHNESSQTLSEVEEHECISTSDVAPVLHPSSQRPHDDLPTTCLSSPMSSTDERTESLQSTGNAKLMDGVNENSSDSEESPEQPVVSNKKTLLKMLASAYMSYKQPPQMKPPQCDQNKRALPPRKVSPRAPVQASNSLFSVNQLRQKIAKYASNREGFIPSNRTFSSKSSVVSVTKALCPVVALETRQKLCRDNIEGRYQCGKCRKVFQNKDSLIIHHTLHRKERVKFCRRCQQFVISVFSLPDNHICSGSGTSSCFPRLVYPQKIFRCHLCNRTYTRRHRLKTHNCQPRTASTPKKSTVFNIRGSSNAREHISSVKNVTSHANVAVNTEGINHIKTEEIAQSPQEDKFQINHSSYKFETSPKRFPPFLPKTSKLALAQSEDNTNEMLIKEESVDASHVDTEGKLGSNQEASESLERGQWTVPLDDAEMDVLSDEENFSNSEEATKENTDDEVIILEPSANSGTTHSTSKDIQVHLSDGGIRRYSCSRCHKSYSRRFTLNQHLMICRSRKLMESSSYGSVSAKLHGVKKKFPCPHCGSSFTRKDNMNMHRKRCQSMRDAKTLRGNAILEKPNQAAQENMFVLPPVSKSQVRQEGSSNVGSGSWGIMSLPSVLPRKVTCECGASFTCPRLLFEHLQMHALESYICSHCGENLQSWADFEAHQQLHHHPSRTNIEDRGAHQQLHVQPQLQQVASIQTSKQNPKKDSPGLFKSRLNHRPLTGPYVCHRCKKIFRLRKSLLRHLTRSCKGYSTTENKHSCSRCGMTFQNSLAQEVHMRGNTCTPAFKPLRCPVCVRWFSSLEGLKRHLLSHSQEQSLTCQICGCKCSSTAALQEHKQSVHGISKASESPTVQSAHVSQSSSSDAFRCQICQRSYPKLQSLKDHLRKVHRPKHANPISVGNSKDSKGQGFVQQGQTKQFQCQICARTYPDVQSLKNHKRRVHRILGGGLQPSRGNLQQSHSNLFQCLICSRTYPDIRSLSNHRRRVHRILGGLGLEMYKGITHQSLSCIFKCEICQQSYPDLGALNNHKRMEHCILRDVLESTKMDETKMDAMLMEQSQSDVFRVTDTSGNFEPIA